MGSEDARGLVAVRGDDVVGWMKVTRRATLPKLLARFPYRGLDDPGDVFAIGCFLVDPALRRDGVAAALLDSAIAHAPSWGARFLEAYPRASDAPLHEGELWQGPHALFTSRGFVVVREASQYPVLRRARCKGLSIDAPGLKPGAPTTPQARGLSPRASRPESLADVALLQTAEGSSASPA